MSYSYDQPLVLTHNVGTVTFGTTGVTTLPAQMTAALAHSNGSRLLEAATVLGVAGRVTTVGAGVIQIGDGSDADRYGTFTIEDSPTLNGALQGKLVLTDEGFRMGVADSTVADTFVLTYTGGTAVVANLTLVIGYF